MNSLIEIRKSSIQGDGVFATREIKKGELIFDWNICAKKITIEQFQKLPESEKHFVSMQNGSYFLFQKEARKVNHSCNPNLSHKGTQDFANQDIHKGEELTIDYSQESAQVKFSCNCKSNNCKNK